jgi:hypothetical protein
VTSVDMREKKRKTDFTRDEKRPITRLEDFARSLAIATGTISYTFTSRDASHNPAHAPARTLDKGRPSSDREGIQCGRGDRAKYDLCDLWGVIP